MTFVLFISRLFILSLQPLGAADYLALCRNFDIIILRNIPQMTLTKKSEARRFMTLVDAFYDSRVGIGVFFDTMFG